jgi:Ca2+/H+ antiporter
MALYCCIYMIPGIEYFSDSFIHSLKHLGFKLSEFRSCHVIHSTKISIYLSADGGSDYFYGSLFLRRRKFR